MMASLSRIVSNSRFATVRSLIVRLNCLYHSVRHGFKIEKEASLIKTLSGPYEITWQFEKVLAYRQLTYTIKKYQGKLKAADVHDDSDEEAGESPSDEGDMVVEQGGERRPLP